MGPLFASLGMILIGLVLIVVGAISGGVLIPMGTLSIVLGALRLFGYQAVVPIIRMSCCCSGHAVARSRNPASSSESVLLEARTDALCP